MIKIKKVNKKFDVYDIQVPKSKNFYANGILVHNCEIYQYTDEEKTAICTLSSMVLKNFIVDGKFDFQLLHQETRRVTRALNKVIDINKYVTSKGEKGGLEQRAIAIGVQGLADVFFLLDYVFDSEQAIKLNKEIFETIYHAAITESASLCEEGKYKPYAYFEGSPMSKGIFQFDMWGISEDSLSGLWDWKALKSKVMKHGVSNSLFTAQMPVACQVKETEIITEDGIKSMAQIMEEHGIDFSSIEKDVNGGKWFDFKSPINVETMFGKKESSRIYYSGHAKILSIEMEDGLVFECSENHQFLVNSKDGQYWKQAKDLEEEDDIVNIFEQHLKIKKIKDGGVKPVWDIEVPEGNHYIMKNGCVSHNSSAKITGSFEMTEPAHSALFSRRVVGGEIVIANKYLINDFEELGIWGENLKNEIIMNDGSIANINFNRYFDPESKNYENQIERASHLIKKYRTTWEIPQKSIVDMAADRGLFIDQSQSMNLYLSNPTLQKFTSAIVYGSNKGLKTLSYYIRTKAISTGAKHLATDVSKFARENVETKVSHTTTIEKPTILPQKPEDSQFDCVGCSS